MCAFVGISHAASVSASMGEREKKISLVIMVSGFHWALCECVRPVTWVLAVFFTSSSAVVVPISTLIVFT